VYTASIIKAMIALMEVVRNSVMSVYFSQTTRRYIPERFYRNVCQISKRNIQRVESMYVASDICLLKIFIFRFI
jgi:hypothetical protein